MPSGHQESFNPKRRWNNHNSTWGARGRDILGSQELIAPSEVPISVRRLPNGGPRGLLRRLGEIPGPLSEPSL